MDLREGTTINIKMGPFVSQTDGFTPKTALTPTVKLSKNGGTLAARNSATATAHDADGYYTIELNTTDTGTRGRLRATARDDSNHLPVWEDFNVMSKADYDTKYAATFLLQSATSTTATLDAGASAVNDYYNGLLLSIIAGTGAGQVALVTDYVGSTKVCTILTGTPTNVWATIPDSTSQFMFVPFASFITSLTAAERNAIADALLDRTDGIETGLTPRNQMRLVAAATAGKASGAASTPVVYRNAVADSKNRISATVDSSGNRTAITVDLT